MRSFGPYRVTLLDRQLAPIADNEVDTLCAAKQRARRMLADDYATSAETTHEAWGTFKVEVHDSAGDCVFDQFHPSAVDE
jgi:hypothetical protein